MQDSRTKRMRDEGRDQDSENGHRQQRSAARRVLEWDWDPEPLLGDRCSPPGGLRRGFLGKWNSKEWIKDFTKRNIHGITDSQTGPTLDDLEKMIPQEVSKMH